MKISVQLETATRTPPDVRYTWSHGTEILSAQLAGDALGEPTIATSASVGLEGRDGSWLILEVAAGQIAGIEVAVWPKLRRLPEVTAPERVDDARALVPALCRRVRSLDTGARVTAEADPSEQNFHFRLGRTRNGRTVRIARDLLLDVDEQSHITGLWLLNVPPSSVES
ncbi:MAG TPA: hypothetical protein VGM67_10085 [Gemmatimonadaceae bacterium]|jgi:hypothetical protein